MRRKRSYVCMLTLLMVVSAFSIVSAGERLPAKYDLNLTSAFCDGSDAGVSVGSLDRGASSGPLRSFRESRGTIIGITWYEYQHNGSMGRQIGYSAGSAYSGVHFVWMRSMAAGGVRRIAYNAYDGAEWAWDVGSAGGKDISEARGGYTTLGVTTDGAAVVAFHEGICGDLLVTKAARDSDPPAGQFDFGDGAPGPPNCEGWISGDYEIASKYIWPVIDNDNVGGDHVMHVVSCESPPSGTVVAEVQTVVYYRVVNGTYPTCGHAIDSVYDISPVVRSDPNSDDVAVVWLKPMYYEDDPEDPCGYTQWQNDVVYIESTDGGLSWGPTINVTDYSQGQTLAPDQIEYQAYTDVSALYDNAGVLHIVWSTPLRDLDGEDPCVPMYATKLWHWDQDNGCVTLVYDAVRPRYHCPQGAFNRTTAKMNISECYSSSEGEYGLFVMFTRFGAHVSSDGDTNIDCSDPSDHGFYANGDIFLVASSDGGLTWGSDPNAAVYADTSNANGEPISLGGAMNLTNTFTPDCLPGECHSEHWGSMAPYSVDSMFIMYIDDGDAGASIRRDPREGMPTECRVRYMNYPFYKPQPRCSVTVSPETVDLTIAPEGMEGCAFPDTAGFTLTLANLGNQPSDYTATVSSAWLEPSELLGSVPRGCDTTSDIVYQVGPIAAPGLYQDTITIAYGCAQGAGAVKVGVTVHVTCGGVDTEYQVLSTACWSVAVWNIGRSGLAEIDDEGNMFWFTGGIPLMYDEGIIVTDADDTSNTWFSLSDGSLSDVGFIATGPLMTEAFPVYEHASASWVNGDTSLAGFTEYFLPTDPDTCVLVERTTVCNCDSAESVTLHIGQAIDWNIANGEAGSADRCGVDEGRQMVYQYGTPGASSENYFGGASFRDNIVGAIVLENEDWLYPNSGFTPAEIGGLLARHSGFEAITPDSLQDIISLYVVDRNEALQAGECTICCMVMASSLAGITELRAAIDRGIIWMASIEAPPSSAQGDVFYYNIDGYVPGEEISVTGSRWYELQPGSCEYWTATAYCDDGDEELGEGDLVAFENDSTHEDACSYVLNVSAAMRVRGLCSNDTVYLSYLDPTPSGDPVGSPVGAWWREVAPDYGQYRYITGWWDDGNGYLDSLDYVAIADSLVRSALLCRVEEVTISMISDPLRVSDANSSGEEDIDDVVYIISYIFTGGPAPTPCPVTSGDADCSCEIDVDDVVYAIEYIFLGGSAPCQCDEWITGCSHLCY